MWTLVILIGAFALMSALAPKQPDPKPKALEDFDFPRAEEGAEQHAVFGQRWSKGWMVLTVGNYRTRRVTVRGGGKK